MTKQPEIDNESKSQLEKLTLKLPGTEICCWGIGQNMMHGRGRHYFGVIAAVDQKDPGKLYIKDGNITEILLHFRPGDHVVTLREVAEGNTADFTTHIECGFDFEKMKPIMLLDFMKGILES